MTKQQASRAEKQRFFADLDHLDDTDEETEDELDIKHSPYVNRPRSLADRPPQSSKSRQQQQRNRQSPLKGSSEAPIILHDTPDLHTHGTEEAIQSPTSPTRPAPRTEVKTADPSAKRLLKPQDVHLADGRRPKRIKKVKDELQLVPEQKRIFNGLIFFFVPNDDIVKSRRLRILRAREHGAQRAVEFDISVTHVIVEQEINYQEAAKAFPNRHIPKGTVLVRTSWLSESLNALYLRDVDQSRFRLRGAPEPSRPSKDKSPPSEPQGAKTKQPRSLYSPSREVYDYEQHVVEDELEGFVKQVKENGHLPSDIDNPNHQTITILQEMATYYGRTGDHWRTTAYRKAISALRKQNVLISTRVQAQAIPQIGARIADKIEEIASTNGLRRLENARNDPQDQILQLFMGIYGVGRKQASQWIAQGHRTLSDLLEKAILTPNQRIGIDHYDDFMKRIPREEVAQHGEIVREACRKVDVGLEVIIGGSFRRGSNDSGDIDLILTKFNADMAQIRTLVFQHVIPSLFKSGFLKCTLASSSSALSPTNTNSPTHDVSHDTTRNSSSSDSGSKFHGASSIPAFSSYLSPSNPQSNGVWRRIDLLFVPSASLGASLLYFTGNDIFNRSMRLLASKRNMRLDQHGLYKDVMRGKGRVKVTEGTLVEGRSERKIFELLGVPWREPWERVC